ncbi:TatD family hydrolase [Desulfomonile tiedjei]|uniref:Hydrolase, TatD family n=1 Tax=Desulfomonile tiedjei (strain ATCC 49306 / DSM 6799 / DCB-1) TaxID=706587 RepID=I4C099_DESTA|nr:TatD family hydrolase [Desulfomonile tiedjei]AFM22990.1 hydrolase, TatD family [Desulfomonile tiedjei DSM 6799]
MIHSGKTTSKPMLVDTHAHLELDPLFGRCEQVVANAVSAGIVAIVTVGIDLEDVERALNVAERFPHVYACVGFHPHNAKEAAAAGLSQMEIYAKHPKVVGYGEIGLDFFRNHSPRDIQIRIFEEQLSLAKNLGKPVVIHLRDAYREGLEILERSAPYPAGGVIHCFSGTQADADRAVALGFHISIPGTVTYKKNDALRSIAQKCPKERILLETDCPFLSPEPLRGKDNEPANIVYTAKKVAEVLGIPYESVCELTTTNARHFFGLAVDASLSKQ